MAFELIKAQGAIEKLEKELEKALKEVEYWKNEPRWQVFHEVLDKCGIPCAGSPTVQERLAAYVKLSSTDRLEKMTKERDRWKAEVARLDGLLQQRDEGG